MRIRRVRFDIWLCLLLAFGVSLGTVKLAELFLDDMYGRYEEDHTVADGEIGGKAGPGVFRAESVDDLLSHDTFTIVTEGIEYRNRGSGYLDGRLYQAVTLASGERVAVILNSDSVQVEGDYMTGIHTMPVGRVVYKDLAAETTFLGQIEYKEPLSRRDFYVDMLGEGGKMDQEMYTDSWTGGVQVLTILVCFPIFHSLGAKLGLFPFFFAPRKKKGEEEQKGEWD